MGRELSQVRLNTYNSGLRELRGRGERSDPAGREKCKGTPTGRELEKKFSNRA